jgi:hypothetical protein
MDVAQVIDVAQTLLPNATYFSRFRAIAQMVGRTPSSEADPLVGSSVVAPD